MRDSALKPRRVLVLFAKTHVGEVGEELMRDSALKRDHGTGWAATVDALSEKSSCATAL